LRNTVRQMCPAQHKVVLLPHFVERVVYIEVTGR
jgi:hypothetical protein